MSTVVRAENISKIYRLGDVGSATLTEDLRTFWYKTRGKQNPYMQKADANKRDEAGASSGYVWALKDINFSINQGEIVGLVGRNGAGKSTLLKILSRTTSPSTGQIGIKGRVASLLEVGTGFHPDLTGRDNIFLNGAILGMRKQEIKSKFDAIVEFAGVQRYIDTPVKRYSSGMYVRLAFAVAAHLDPDILIIDEVLAVGDSEFQSKCLGKMKDVSEQGRTVIFVSHNMGAVADLCSRAILLQHGGITLDADTGTVIRAYVQQNMRVNLNDADALKDATVRRGTGEVRYDKIRMLNNVGEETNEFLPGSDIRFELTCKLNQPVTKIMASIAFRSGRTREFVTSTPKILLDTSNAKQGDTLTFELVFPASTVRPGVYETYYWLGDDRVETAFDVVDNLLSPLVIKVPPDVNPLLVNGYFDLPFKFSQLK
jgi:lipopolysaccharide transport system ATP-binding protein